MNMDNFFDVISTRRTVREFDSYNISDDEIKKIIDSARLAPSAVNAQNWKFIAIVNDTIKEQMALCVKNKYKEIIDKIEDANLKARVSAFVPHSTFFTTASALIIVVETKHPKFLEGVLETAGYNESEIFSMRPDSQLLSMGGAVENMSLMSHALGLASCWMVAPIIAHDDFAKLLKLNQDDKIVSLLAIGKPIENLSPRAHKKNIDDIMQILR